MVTSSPSLDWIKFKRSFNKNYKTAAEEAERKQIFLENVNRMRDYERAHPDATFKIGINHLADHRIDELVLHSKHYSVPRPENTQSSSDFINFPDSFDWRTKEVVESLYAIQKGKLVRGSVGRVDDCCPQTVEPFQCIKKLGGICSAADYPAPTGQCIPNKCKPFAHFDIIMKLKDQNEDTMVAWIQNSTLYVGVDASQTSFQFYQTGIYTDPSCSKTTVDHVMQLVGYGKTASGDLFWICKNSWGTSWGEKGYIRILRGKNICGIASYVMQIA
ncbi:unnamed protein product [Rotaria socialis]|uniref:Uncharacterized protein n=1 Tax=Rotaria socialis TaxID=392032 RepID=A0A820V0H6_9BILA|nr:unnamed protein product [Rotaria socialis]